MKHKRPKHLFLLFVIGLTHTLWAQNDVPFAYFNRSYEHSDTGAKLYIDGVLVFQTASINQTFDLSVRHIIPITPGKHWVRTESLDGSFWDEDSIFVKNDTSYHRLWIDYEYIPTPDEQLEIRAQKLVEAASKLPDYNPRDSAEIYEMAKFRLSAKQNRWLKEPVAPKFVIKWGYAIKE